MKDIDLLELFRYLKTEEAKDLVEAYVKQTHVSSGAAKILQQKTDLEAIAFQLDNYVKKVPTVTPSKNVLKQLAIDNYVLKKKEEKRLSWKETHELLNTIVIGLILKTISSKDFVWNNGEIEFITGLDFFDKSEISNNAGYV